MVKERKNPIVKPNNPPIKKKRKPIPKKPKIKTSEEERGRPLKFESAEILEKEIEKYFKSCFEEQWKDRDWRDEQWNRKKTKDWWKKEPYKTTVMIKVPTISWLAVALDTSRRTLVNYEDKKEYFHTIKKAKQFIESIVEEWALNGTFNPTSSIFNLKNNFDWKDKTEQDTKLTWELTLAWSLLEMKKIPQKSEI